MASGKQGGGADHPAVKKFSTVDGAKKNVKPIDPSVVNGTTYPNGGPGSSQRK